MISKTDSTLLIYVTEHMRVKVYIRARTSNSTNYPCQSDRKPEK